MIVLARHSRAFDGLEAVPLAKLSGQPMIASQRGSLMRQVLDEALAEGMQQKAQEFRAGGAQLYREA